MTVSGQAHQLTVPDGIEPSEVTQDTLTGRDGVEIYFEVVGNASGKKTMVLANGLGGRLYSWAPLLRHFKDQFQFVTWDYRGLFESGAPDRIRRLSVMDHAEDLKEILDVVGSGPVTVTGWSMGVQVGLEFTSLYPDSVEGLILLNGSYGHVFSSAFQPKYRFPYMGNLLHAVIEMAGDHPKIVNFIGDFILENLDKVVAAQIAVSPGSKNRDEMKDAMKQYFRDIFGTEFRNYLRLFQELDAHSVYHLLPDLEQPALIVSGGLDMLTPSYESEVLLRRLPNARHRHLRLANHFAMLEFPETVLEEIEVFLEDNGLLESPKEPGDKPEALEK